jgi:N6-L-threonylcarbamoyladenine synthase
MVILGIETSCDETSAAIVSDRNVVESLVTTSSSDAFSLIGGVIPEEAARKQMECILPVIDQSLRDAKRSWSDIDAIAVTKGPGLLGSLLVGTTTARALGAIQGKPLIGVHHIRGHLDSVWLDRDDDLPFPCLTLAVSGGHTQLFLRSSHTKEILLGTTQDDAAGEAFDKAAKLLGLPYSNSHRLKGG